MKRIISTVIAALMMVNVVSVSAFAGWDPSQIQSQVTYSRTSNGMVLQSTTFAFQAGGLTAQQITKYNAAGQILSVQNAADGKFTTLYHYNNAGNLDSVDQQSTDPSSGAPIVRTTYYLGGGMSITVPRGANSTINATGTGLDGATSGYTSSQLQGYVDAILTQGKTWESLGVTDISGWQISISGASLANLNADQVARLYNVDMSQTSGSFNPSSGFKVGDPIYDYNTGQRTNATVTGFVVIDGVLYGLGSNGELVRNANGKMQTGPWGSYTANADGSLTVTVTHNTMNDNGWLGTATISKDGVVTIKEGDTKHGDADEVINKGGGFSATYTDSEGNKHTGTSSVIINGLVYGYEGGKLYSPTGAQVGTYSGNSATICAGLYVVSQIMEAAAANPYSTFTVSFGTDEKTKNQPVSLSYYDSKQGTLTVSLKAPKRDAVQQRDPLVTGTINSVSQVTVDGVTHYYINVAASQIDMFDNTQGEAYQVDGETIMIEVDRGTFDSAGANIGQEITIAGNVTQDQDGRLSINATSAATQQNVSGYKQDVKIGAVGTTLAAWRSNEQNNNYFNTMVSRTMAFYTSLGILNSGLQAKWDALRGGSGAQFSNTMGKRVQTGIQPNF